MATNLRVGGTHAYQPYREIEPVPPSPQINQQQPRSEYLHQQSEPRADKKDHAQRRFRAMRNLIDQLKETARITRVDYFTAETELNNLGLAIADKELIEQLLELNFSLEEIDGLFQQIRQKPTTPDLEAGHKLSETNNFFPVFIPELFEYNLCFQKLQVLSGNTDGRIIENIEKDGRFVSEKNRLRLDFRQTAMPEEVEKRQLNIRILVAVSEVDEAGRRVILYQRPNQSYALYADKQIDLSI